jgi:hypothetical protein
MEGRTQPSMTGWARTRVAMHRLFDIAKMGCDDQREMVRDATTMTTCGYCVNKIETFMENGNQVVMAGTCGHLFHGGRVNRNDSCYTRYTMSVPATVNDACVHCRVTSIGNNRAREPPRHPAARKRARATYRSPQREVTSPQRQMTPTNSEGEMNDDEEPGEV